MSRGRVAASGSPEPDSTPNAVSHPLVAKIRSRRIFPPGYLNSLDIDSVFSQWDADEAGHTAFNAILNEVGEPVDPDLQEIRDLVFDQVFTFTKHYELSACVCEEIGLIIQCHRFHHDDAWLKEREGHYLAGRLPYVGPARAPGSTRP